MKTMKYSSNLCFFFLQSTILREDLMGFVFESNRGTRHSFTAETTLGQEFSIGWGGKKSRKLKSKNSIFIRDKVMLSFFFKNLL